MNEVSTVRRRYVISLERTADDRIVGIVRRDGEAEPVPFSGWQEFISLLETPPVVESEPGLGEDTQRRRAG